MFGETKLAYPNAPGDTLEDGRRFQDYVTFRMAGLGIHIEQFSSRLSQYRFGESLHNYEIKLDRMWWTTNNLYIEVAERARKENAWTASGICRADDSIYFVIGDFQRFWVFARRHLLWVLDKRKPRIVESDTSRAFLLPLDKADTLAIHVVGQVGEYNPVQIARELCHAMSDDQLDVLMAEIIKLKGNAHK